MLRAFDEGQKRFAKDPEPDAGSDQVMAGIDRRSRCRSSRASTGYSQSRSDPESAVSLADPANHSKGAAGF